MLVISPSPQVVLPPGRPDYGRQGGEVGAATGQRLWKAALGSGDFTMKNGGFNGI